MRATPMGPGFDTASLHRRRPQVEVAFREQTAGHNALLLFVHLALSMMEARLRNAFRELRAKRAEARALSAASLNRLL